VGAVFAAKRSIARSLTSRALIALLRIGNDHSRASRNCASARLPETGPAVSQPVPGPLRVGPRGHCSHHRPLVGLLQPEAFHRAHDETEERRVERVDQARGKKSLCDRKVHDGNSKEIAGQDADGRADAQSDLDARLAEVERDLAEGALAHALPDTEGSYWRGSRAVDRRRQRTPPPTRARAPPAGVVPRRKQEHYAIGAP
jgi:hypothetical protein